MTLLALIPILLADNFHGGAKLLSSVRSAAPGSSFEVAVRISLDPGWHTYWLNAGDAGIPPKISWRLPLGWKASDVQWPTPHRLVAPELVSYGYEKEVLLLVKMTVSRTAKIGSKVDLEAKVDWLVCSDGCIPARALVNSSVAIGSASEPDPVSAPIINKAVAMLPRPAPNGAVSATLNDKLIALSFANPGDRPPHTATFFALDPVVEPSAPQLFKPTHGLSSLDLKLSQFAPASVSRLRGLLVTERGSQSTSQIVDIPLMRRSL